MAIVKPQFEFIDQSGVTTCYNGTVNNTGILLPPVADKCISSYLVVFPNDGSYDVITDRLIVEPKNDGCGITLCPDGAHSAKLRGCIKQIKIKSKDATVLPYEVIINFESTTA